MFESFKIAVALVVFVCAAQLVPAQQLGDSFRRVKPSRRSDPYERLARIANSESHAFIRCKVLRSGRVAELLVR